MMSDIDKFDLLLMNAIDEELIKYGSYNKDLVYEYIKKRYLINRKDLPSNLGVLEDALKQLYGIGYDFVIRNIMRNFYQSMHIEFEDNDKWRMTDYLKFARAIIRP